MERVQLFQRAEDAAKSLESEEKKPHRRSDIFGSGDSDEEEERAGVIA